MGDITTIPISKKTRDRLRTLGTKGETYDQLIQRLIVSGEQLQLMKRQYDMFPNKDDFMPLDEG
jgi:hypothetical protein